MQAGPSQAGPSSARQTHRLPLRLSLETPSDSGRDLSSHALPSTTNTREAAVANETVGDPSTSDPVNVRQLVKYRAEAVLKNPNYSWTRTRQIMKTQVSIRCRGKIPYYWQTDVSEAMWYGKDCVIIAGTGFGKTLPFVMPLLVDKAGKSKALIVSTLNELERDQADRFNEMDLKSLAVNGNSWNAVKKDILAKDFRVIITSPEMILLHPIFSKLVRDATWMEDFRYTIVDEAHCIVPWGKEFRKTFSDLGKLRSFMIAKPMVIASATLPPPLLEETLSILDFHRDDMFLINLGNDRHNITMVMCKLLGAKNDIAALNFLVDEARQGKDLIRTILYVTECEIARTAFLHLLSQMPPHQHNQIAFITGKMTDRAKSRIMRLFRDGTIKLLVATEVAGMGMDIRDIRRIVQFLLPNTLAEWYQHAGRAGRDGLPAIAIILVEASFFQTKKNKQLGATTTAPPKKRKGKQPAVAIKQEPLEPLVPQKRNHQEVDAQTQDEDVPESEAVQNDASKSESETREPVKKVEPALRQWCDTLLCRRQLQNTYFRNPTCQKELITCCCDNCLREKGSRKEQPLTDAEVELLALIARIEGRSRLRSNADLPAVKVTSHAKKLQENLFELLTDWRNDYYRQHAEGSILTPNIFMPDKTLKSLATYSHIQSEEDIARFLPDWMYGCRLGAEVLEAIRAAVASWDAIQDEIREQKRLEGYDTRNAQRRQETAVRNALAGKPLKIKEQIAPGEITFEFYNGENAQFVSELSAEPQPSTSMTFQSESQQSSAAPPSRTPSAYLDLTSPPHGFAPPAPANPTPTCPRSYIPAFHGPVPLPLQHAATSMTFAPQPPAATFTPTLPLSYPLQFATDTISNETPMPSSAAATSPANPASQPAKFKVRFQDDIKAEQASRKSQRRKGRSVSNAGGSSQGMSKTVKSELLADSSLN